MDFLPDITPAPAPYDFDQQNQLTVDLEWFGNCSLDDCVTAARANHTIRFVWARSRSTANISESDVITQYYLETQPPHQDTGLDLGNSLTEWQNQGWAYGDQSVNPLTKHKTQSISGQYGIDGGYYPPPFDQTLILTLQKLQIGICCNCGAQVGIFLPQGVAANDDSTYGPDHPWDDTDTNMGPQHVVLLTGYDDNYFYGISWAKRQPMTWEFLQAHCFGVFFVQPNETT